MYIIANLHIIVSCMVLSLHSIVTDIVISMHLHIIVAYISLLAIYYCPIHSIVTLSYINVTFFIQVCNMMMFFYAVRRMLDYRVSALS